MTVFFICLGGALGAVIRYFLSLVLDKVNIYEFPLSILGVNTLGSFFCGIISSIPLQKSFKCFLLIGFLGALTTFSSYAYKMLSLLETNKYALLMGHILLNNVLCFCAVFCGKKIAKSFLL